MARTTIVEPGDCFYNLSRQEGFHWETLWNHSHNADLRERRKHPNVLLPGDEVFVPDLTVKEVARPTDQRHRFMHKGVQARFTVTLLDMGRPRANERYILTVDGKSKEGRTNANGELTESIPPDAREGILLLGENREEMTIHFGYIDPIEEIRGVQSRLKNLGFYDAAIDDKLTPETSAAIAEFQRSINLLADGELTDETRQALVQAHGS